MVLIDDVAVGFGAAVATASLIVLLAFLSRYRKLVNDANYSSNLAKNLWDAMNTRLTTQDARIVDLMAKVEVLSVKNVGAFHTSVGPLPSTRDVSDQLSRVQPAVTQTSRQISRSVPAPVQSEGTTNDGTQGKILRILLQGPRTPNQIREVIGVSREHTGRLMKSLFQRGLVVRNDRNKPYVYEISEAGRRYVSSAV